MDTKTREYLLEENMSECLDETQHIEVELVRYKLG